MERPPFEDDVSLVEACVNRDLAAWGYFTKKYAGLITISIKNCLKKYNFTLPGQDIEDIKQNLFVSIWKYNKLAAIRNRKDISYWLAIVAGNEALGFLKKRRAKEPVKPVSLFGKIGERELVEFLPSGGAGPKEELARTEFSEKLDEALESLSVKERLILKLTLFHDKKYHEIAEMMGIPMGTVSSSAKRAKEKLKEKLKDFLQ